MNTGFIKIHRKILNWEWYQDPNTFMLFIHLLFKANYKDTRFQGIEVKRGQCITGRIALSDETKISQQSIRTSLKKLVSSGELTIQPTNRFSLVTIVKYNDYQDDSREPTNNQPTTNQQLTTSKEVKEVKNNIASVKKLDFSVWPDLPTDQILKDWVTSRGKYKITQTVINAFGKEIHKAKAKGYTADSCISECVVRGWRGFKSDWLQGKSADQEFYQ